MPSIAESFLTSAVSKLEQTQREIGRCAELLTEEQMWHRGGDHENSIANLLLHLEGNMRQWILHGVAEQPDTRQRDEEFCLEPTITGADALQRFNATVAESCTVIRAVSEERMLEITDPQPTGTRRHLTVLAVIFQVVGHVQLHTGQIILLTKQLAQRDLDLSMPRRR